ncbi:MULTISPECIES: effector protein Tle3 domain-containing protein [Pseudomonas syringae group]|uniref:effector protein Tle3 domain-containing protein n=1 Tax=Pseudomonas syringae group TaxID=136849 RepID=UPI000A498461
MAGVISQAPVEIGQLCLINAEPLSPPHEPQMFGGEFESGTATTAGLDKPDDVSINAALGNPSAKFNWINIRTYSGRIDLEQEHDRWNKGKASGDQTSAMQSRRLTGEGAPKPSDRYALEREETPNEIRARLAEAPELDPNSYHFAVLRSPENQRWVTAMDIAIGQAKCLDDPEMREVLVAIANWRIDKTIFGIIERLPGWAKISAEAQTLVKASHAYYQRGIFPPSGLVSLTPPSLVTAPLEKGGEK